jgi:hypothetical protein
MLQDLSPSKLLLRVESNREEPAVNVADVPMNPPAEPRFPALRRAIAAFVPDAAPAAPWSGTKRVSFRFLFLYLVLTFFPSPLTQIPGVGVLFKPYGTLVDWIGVWVGTHVWKFDKVPTEPTGSGDTAENWALASFFVLLALVGTIAWSIAARRVKEHATLHAATHVWVRYLLGLVLLSYGMSKVLKAQFPTPEGDDLLETYGQSTPMHILWTFMGASTAYTVFGGVMEAVSGLLLFWRRTATLGALVAAGVMTNVVMLNLCYDVPVKLYSSQLLLMAVFLAAPDLPRFGRVLVLGQGVEPAPARVPLRARWARWTKRGVKVAFLGVALFGIVQGAREAWKTWGDGMPFPSLYGIYDVESFLRRGEAVPPLMTDAKRWKRVVFDKYGYVSFYGVDDAERSFMLENDETKRTLALKSKKWGELTLSYTRPDPEHMTLAGTYDGDPIALTLKRADESKMELIHRGFHWVNEVPANR